MSARHAPMNEALRSEHDLPHEPPSSRSQLQTLLHTACVLYRLGGPAVPVARPAAAAPLSHQVFIVGHLRKFIFVSSILYNLEYYIGVITIMQYTYILSSY